MRWYRDTLTLSTRGKGLHPFTENVNRLLQSWGIREGMCHLFIQHTSASLVVSENYDPTAREDLEEFMDRLVPENQSWHRHDLEGPDDSALTHTSVSIPVENGRLYLGNWQDLYLFEHRRSPHQRKILLRCLAME
jgi:secondary thiamine-phosphate synthase enzyme